MSDQLCYRGVLRRRDPCWVVETAETVVALLGALSGVREGDQVYVCGTKAEASFCDCPTALLVTWITSKYGGEDALPSTVRRNVTVKVTLSSRDSLPVFELEGTDLSLTGQHRHWLGEFPDVTVTGKLNVFFRSKGWLDQEFTLVVAAVDPINTASTWKKEFKKTVDKGRVTFDETIDVGAAT
jgi:hypothetical protein